MKKLTFQVNHVMFFDSLRVINVADLTYKIILRISDTETGNR